MSEQLALQPRNEQTALKPMEMIQVAFQKALESGGAEALAVADRILEQMAKQRDYEDRERFNAALRRIQDKLKPIVKRSRNDQTNSKYANSEAIDREIEPLIQAEGMTLTFEPEASATPQMIRIIGVLSLGAYSRRYPLEMPTDGQGPKGGGVMTRTHATGSAIAYGIRYLKRMIFNLQLKDDDGNAAGAGRVVSLVERRTTELLEFIKAAPDRAKLQKQYLDALAEAEKIGDAKAIRDIIAAKDKRLREL
jgi:hypothetical protein